MTTTVKRLADRGLVEHELYKGVELTDPGAGEAVAAIRRHRIVERFLSDMLGYAWNEADRLATSFEHELPQEVEDRIFIALDRPATCPHGFPIPEPETDDLPDMPPLYDLEPGDVAVVAVPGSTDPEVVAFLDTLGLRPGGRVEVREKHPFDGPARAARRRQGPHARPHGRPTGLRPTGRRSELTLRMGGDPRRVYLVYSAATGFAFMMAATATSVYLITRLGLNPLELVLVGTVLEVTVTLCEVPTGVVADTVSRKLSIIIGLALVAVGFVLYAVPNYSVVLLGQVFWGLGYTFTSGADVAWITDEIGETAARPLYVRAAQVKQLAHLAGIVAGGAVGVLALWAPILIGGLLHLAIAGWLILRMPETGFVRPADGERHRSRNTLKNARRTLSAHPALFLVLGVVLLAGLASEGRDRLWQLHLLADTGLPAGAPAIVWISGLYFVGLVAAIGVTELVRRRADLHSDRGVERTIELVVERDDRGHSRLRARRLLLVGGRPDGGRDRRFAGVRTGRRCLGEPWPRPPQPRHDQLTRQPGRRHRSSRRRSDLRDDRPADLDPDGSGRGGARTASVLARARPPAPPAGGRLG